MIHLIRHPPVAVPAGVCYGRSDVALAQAVDTLAHALRARLPENFALFSSPSTRCRQLAEALGAPQFDARLMEINFGDWEMQRFDAIGHAAIDAWAAAPLDFTPPGGESARQMQQRALAALEAALDSSVAAIVIVSHGGPLRAIAGKLLGLNDQEWPRHVFATGALQSLPRPRR